MMSLLAFDKKPPLNSNMIFDFLKLEGSKDRIKLI